MSISSMPPALAEAVSSKQLLIFCGAGVSMLPPSNLPSWWGFNQAILDEAKRLTLREFPELAIEAKENISALSLNDISVASFSDILVRTFAGSGYFPMLETLDSAMPNPNHQALAELGRKRIVRVFVTTNFDTLIEQSFRQMGVPLQVYVNEKDYRSHTFMRPDICEIHKIHGSVKTSDSLVDTVTQKMRGISLPVRSRLASLFRDHHVLVLGYSGTDLIFGEDYLAFSAIDENCPGITWLMQPGKVPSERVRNAVGGAGGRGAIVEGHLPDFLEKLGIDITYVPAENPETSGAQEDKIHKRVRDFFAQPYVGKFCSAAFCVSLFRKIGDELTANSICESLSVHPELNSNEIPITAAIAFVMLTGWALQKRDFHQAIRWLNLDLRLHAGMKHMYQEKNIPVTPQVALEWNRNLTGAYNNLALCYIELEEFEKAQIALDEAQRNAEEAQEQDALSLIYMNRAKLKQEKGDHPDQILNLLRIARKQGRSAGMMQTILQSNLMEAKILLSLAEYDGAYERLMDAEQYVTFSDLGERLTLNCTLADLAFLRGDLDESRRLFLESAALAEVQGSPVMANKIRFTFCFSLGFHKPYRAEIINELKRLLDRRQEIEEYIAAEDINELLNLLNKDGGLDKPSFLFAFQDLNDPESQARRQIASYEFRQELTDIPQCFEWIWNQKYANGNPDRMLDLGKAFLIASKRAGDKEKTALALNYLGVSSDLSGDVKGALEFYKKALDSGDIKQEIKRSITMNITLAKSKLNETSEEIEKIYNQLIDENRHDGNIDEMLRAMSALAVYFAQHHRLSDAIAQMKEALTYCDDAKWEIQREFFLNRINFWEHQANAGKDTETPVQKSQPEDAKSLDRQQLAEMRSKAKSPQELDYLAAAAFDAGLVQEACEISENALAIFKESGIQRDLAVCLNNLATFTHAAGKLETALEYADQALKIYRQLEDIEKQILVQSNIAAFYLAAGDNKKAMENASMCINLAEGRRPNREIALAWHILAMANGAVQKVDEFFYAAQGFIKIYPQIYEPDLETLYNEYLQIVAEKENQPSDEKPSLSKLQEELEEVVRLKDIGEYDGALEMLKNIAGAYQTTEEQARILAETGNVFQSAGKHHDAIAAYREAAGLFLKCGVPELAISAERALAVSMRKSGNAPGAALMLREILQKLPSAPQRVEVIIALCNTLTQQAQEKQNTGEQTAKYLEEADDLFEEARAIEGLNVEILGSIEINSASLSILKGDLEDALKKSKAAQQYFLRCNSQYLDVVEDQIARLQEELADVEK